MPRTTSNHYDLIVIGSGIGGLAFASLMAQTQHKRVLVLERHFKLGGFTHAFTRPGGYSWDVGIHYVGGMQPGSLSRDLMDFVTGGRVEWARMASPFEKFVYPDFTLEVPDDKAAYMQTLIVRFPHERAAIRQYFKDVEAVMNWAAADMVGRASPLTALPMRLGAAPASLALLTTAEYLEQRIRDPRLRAVLASQWGDYGLPPAQSAFAVHSIIVSHYFDGGWYPVGGGGSIAAAIAPIIAAHEGECLVNHDVREILVRDGQAVGVRAAHKGSETEFFAPVVVSDAGARATYLRLLPPSVNVPFRAELEQFPQGHGVVTLYLGLKESAARLGFRGENHWIYAGYDHDALFAQRDGLLAGNPTACYLSFPSLKDPKAKAHTAEIITYLDYAAVERWEAQPWRNRGEAYEALKARLSEGLLDFVDARYPGFKSLVAFQELSTPLSVQHFTGHERGAIYGLPATPARFRLKWPGVKTPVKNLLLTGTDAASLGIGGALMGGALTAAHLQGAFGFFGIVGAAKQAAARRKQAGAAPSTAPTRA
jgi:phytoene dehydrogenase-like protein